MLLDRTTPITYFEDTTVYKQIKYATTDDRIKNSTDHLDVEEGSTNMDAWILVATVFGVVIFICFLFVMYIYHKKGVFIFQ